MQFQFCQFANFLFVLLLSQRELTYIPSLFQISHWRFPECSLRDKFLHFFFIVNVCLMIACAAVTIICFKEVEPVREPIVNRQPHIDLFFQASLFFLLYFLHPSTLLPRVDGFNDLICNSDCIHLQEANHSQNRGVPFFFLTDRHS